MAGRPCSARNPRRTWPRHSRRSRWRGSSRNAPAAAPAAAPSCAGPSESIADRDCRQDQDREGMARVPAGCGRQRCPARRRRNSHSDSRPDGRAREEHAKQQPPTAGVPLLVEKAAALLGTAAAQQGVDATSEVDQRQQSAAEQRKIALELPADPMPAAISAGWASQKSRSVGQQRSATAIEFRAAHAGPGAEEFQQFGMAQFAESGNAQGDTGQLRRAQVQGDDAPGARVSSARALSPAEAMDKQLSPGWMSSASSRMSASSSIAHSGCP